MRRRSKLLVLISLFIFALATFLAARSRTEAKITPQDARLFASQPGHYPFTLIAYGDLRTTKLTNHSRTDPERRQALIARIADERPDIVMIGGDLILNGGDVADWREFARETRAWRDAQFKVLPAIGNHETRGDSKLRNYFHEFPDLHERRWYSARYGNLLLLSMDSESDDNSGSAQWQWLVWELDHLPAETQFVIVSMHHPPYTHSSDHLVPGRGHSVRSSEQQLAKLFESRQSKLQARIIVIASHVHNYERYEHNGVMYIVTGGGGATPYTVTRKPGDFYNQPGPTYHYCRLTVDRGKLKFEMVKLENSASQFVFNVRDVFQLELK